MRTRPALSSRPVGVCLAAYLTLFLFVVAPWLSDLGTLIPDRYFTEDAVLIVWTLAWVSHALTTAPGALFQAPINYPAPAPLVGSEHYLGSQVLFTPLWLATGNALLSANLILLLSYPLAAISACLLLVVLGCGWIAAWMGGALFALSPLHVPLNLKTLQYSNLFFPIIALVLHRLRTRPDAPRAALFGSVLLLGCLSSYYLAVLLMVFVVAWTVVEWQRVVGERWRFVVSVATAGGVAAAILGAISLPYLSATNLVRPDHLGLVQAPAGERPGAVFLPNWKMALLLTFPWLGESPFYGRFGWVLACFQITGLAAAVRSVTTTHTRIARVGLAFSAVSFLLMLGPWAPIAGHDLPLPFVLISHSSARFFRMPFRFCELQHVGTVLLAAAGLDSILELVRSSRVRALLILVASCLVVALAQQLVRDPPVFMPAAGRDGAVYAQVGAMVAEAERGPMLELPRTFENTDRRLGQTSHWLPSVTVLT